MKTRSSLFSVVLLSSLSVAACGQSPSPAPPAPTPPPAPKILHSEPPLPQPVANPPFTMFKDQHTGKQLQLPMIQRSVLNGVPGKINHMAMDPGINRLYVAAKAKNSLEMLDVANNKQPACV